MPTTTTRSPLPELARKINWAVDQYLVALGNTMERAREIGAYLIEAKAAVAHGYWREWVAENVKRFRERQCQRCMQIARRWKEVSAKVNTSPVTYFEWHLGLSILAGHSDEEYAEAAAALADLANLGSETAVRRERERLEAVAAAWVKIVTDVRAIIRRAAVVGDDRLSAWIEEGRRLLAERGRIPA